MSNEISIVDLRFALDESCQTLSAYKKESEKEIARLTAIVEKCRREYGLATDQSLDIARIRNAESILEIRGSIGIRRTSYGELLQRGLGDDLSVVNDAIRWMAGSLEYTAWNDLNRNYYGVKNYDRWTRQRTDCEYGMGPSHGSIVFSIGLNREHRGKGLTEQQRSDCIYYLEAMKAGKLESIKKEAA